MKSVFHRYYRKKYLEDVSHHSQAQLCFPFSISLFFIFPHPSSMAGLNASLPCTNLCAGTIFYGLEQ